MGQSVLTASLSDQVTAAPLRNKKKAHRQNTMTAPPLPPQQGASDYYENLLDKVPFGPSDGGPSNRDGAAGVLSST